MGIEIGLGLAGGQGLLGPGRFAGLEGPQGLVLAELDDGRGGGVVPEKDQPLQVRPPGRGGRAAEPGRIEQGVGLFGGPVAVGRAPVQPAVVGPLALQVLAALLAEGDVLAFAPVEERRQPGVELDRRRRHVELPLDAVGGGPAAGDLDEGDVVRVELEARVGQQLEEELRLFRARRTDEDEAAAVDVGGHAPHRSRGAAARAHRDVHGQADGQAAEGRVVIGVDQDAGLRRLVIEAARLAPGDAVDGVDDAVRLDVGLGRGRREVLDPEIVEMGDVGPQLQDGPADAGVPLVAALVAQVAFHLGDQGVAHAGRRPRRRRGRPS